MSSSRRRWRAPGRGQSTSSGSVYIPPDATTITRDGADAWSRGRSARVSRNGDKTCVANVSSFSSPVAVYAWVSAPAFRTRTSRRSCRSVKRAAKAAVSARDERSARSASTARACRGGDLAAGAFGARRVAPDDADMPAQRRDRLGGRSSEARGRPGHDCHLAVETKRLQRRPAEDASPREVADPGEAANDGRLERPVDESRRGRGRHGFSAVCIPSVARAPTRLKMRCMIGSSSRPSPPNARVAS